MAEIDINKLTDDQIEKMAMAAERMAKKGNQFGEAIHLAIKDKTLKDKRTILMLSYARIFELLVSFQMAINSDMSSDEVRRNL